MSTQGDRAVLLRLLNGFQASQTIHVAATLGLADLLGSGPKTTGDLAVATKAHPAAQVRQGDSQSQYQGGVRSIPTQKKGPQYFVPRQLRRQVIVWRSPGCTLS
jgi:hypothetical protein